MKETWYGDSKMPQGHSPLKKAKYTRDPKIGLRPFWYDPEVLILVKHVDDIKIEMSGEFLHKLRLEACHTYGWQR